MRDPVFDELTALIAAVEQVLGPARIQEIVEASFRQLSVAKRTRDLVDASPQLLTSLDPHSLLRWRDCCCACETRGRKPCVLPDARFAGSSGRYVR